MMPTLDIYEYSMVCEQIQATTYSFLKPQLHDIVYSIYLGFYEFSPQRPFTFSMAHIIII